MSQNQLIELEWQHGNDRVYLKNSAAATVVTSVTHAPATPMKQAEPAAAPSSETPPERKIAANQKQILSPFVGTFYRSPAPDADPYVREGQTIKKGAPLCIIEAMKLMNEIESEFSGKIISVLVESGQPVELDRKSVV